MRLFHFSEDPGIEKFVPRVQRSKNHSVLDEVVWAIAEPMSWTYLTPRDCPRIAFCAGTESREEDIEKLLNGEPDKKVLVLESAWMERCLKTPIYRYEFDLAGFRLQDAPSQAFLAREAQTPIAVVEIARPFFALLEAGVEVRVTPSLWEIRERVYRSSLRWGFIRLRHATAPEKGFENYLPV